MPPAYGRDSIWTNEAHANGVAVGHSWEAPWRVATKPRSVELGPVGARLVLAFEFGDEQ